MAFAVGQFLDSPSRYSSTSPGLSLPRLLGTTPRGVDSGGLQCRPRVCIFNKFPGGADAFVLRLEPG